VIDEEAIAFIVITLDRHSGHPACRRPRPARLLRMEDELHSSVVGQDEAIKAISRAIPSLAARRSQGSQSPDRLVRLLRTEPAWARRSSPGRWPRFLFADSSALIRVDIVGVHGEVLGQPSDRGRPPGYVGYEDSGALTKAMRRKPLLGRPASMKIEKGRTRDVFNILLQVLDEGRLTDNYGRVIDFKNTVVIMTSNVGARDIMQGKTLGLSRAATSRPSFDKMSDKIKEELNKVFNPEFLNRLDDVIIFHPLTKEHIRAGGHHSAQGSAAPAGRRSAPDNRPAIDFPSSTRATIRTMARRPLKRSIQKYIEDPLSERILSGDFRPGLRRSKSIWRP